MAKYYMTTGLWTTDEEEFSSDAEAWNTLRLRIPGKFAYLKKQVEYSCKIVNPNEFVKRWNAKYAIKPIGYGVNEPLDENATEYMIHDEVTVLYGLTDDECN